MKKKGRFFVDEMNIHDELLMPFLSLIFIINNLIEIFSLEMKRLPFKETNKRYVCFKSNKQDTICYDTHFSPLMWYVLIFDGINGPVYISPVSVPED